MRCVIRPRTPLHRRAKPCVGVRKCIPCAAKCDKRRFEGVITGAISGDDKKGEVFVSKVVFKSNYTRSGSKAVNNMKYIATREGVNKSINAKMVLTNLEYIANRPRVVKLGKHGLFGQGDMVDLDRVKAELENHNGIVWMPVVSLRREDAQRLGYDNPQKWRTLLRSMQIELAERYCIPITDFKWYAAFHDEGHHPHIHMIIYNKNPGGEFLKNTDCNKVREGFTKNIFADELKQAYDERQTLRDSIVEEIKNRVNNLQVNPDNMSDEFAEKYHELQKTIGHDFDRYNILKYKFLTPKQKKCVDAVVKEIVKDDNIQKMYEQWCELQLSILRFYYKDPKQCFDKLEDNKDFYRIKNAILKSIQKNEYKNHMVTDRESALPVYENLVFDICQMIDKSCEQTYGEYDHTKYQNKSIVDSKERIRIAKHKQSLGQHMGM